MDELGIGKMFDISISSVLVNSIVVVKGCLIAGRIAGRIDIVGDIVELVVVVEAVDIGIID